MNQLSISGKALNLNRLSRARSISSSAQFNIRAILSRVYVQLNARPIEKGCKKVVLYIRNPLTKEGNQTLNKVKNKGKKVPSLNRLNRARKIEKKSRF